MSLKLLSIGEDSHPLSQDIVIVPASKSENQPEQAAPEMPAVDLDGDAGEAIAQVLTALDAFYESAQANGLCSGDVIALEGHVDGMADRFKGRRRVFTHSRSIEGLAIALEEVQKEKLSVFRRFMEWLKGLYLRFKDWLNKVFGTGGIEDKAKERMEETKKEFSAGEDVNYYDSIYRDPENELTISLAAVDKEGQNTDFRNSVSLTMKETAEKIETFYALCQRTELAKSIASGEYDVKIVYDPTNASEIVRKISKASAMVNKALMARNREGFEQALVEVREQKAVLAEMLEDSSLSSVTNVQSRVDVTSLSFSKIIENVTRITGKMNTSLDKSVFAEFTRQLDSMIDLADKTDYDLVAEMTPDGYDGETRRTAINDILDVVKSVSDLSRRLLLLWQSRASLATTGAALYSAAALVKRTHATMIAATEAALDDAGKEALANYLRARGLTISDDSEAA